MSKANTVLMISLAIILAACQSTTELTATPDFAETPIISTVTRALEQSTVVPTPSATYTLQPTALPTATITPTYTPFPTPEPTPFNKDVTITRISYAAPFGIRENIGYTIEDSQLFIYNLLDPINPSLVWRSESLGIVVEGLTVKDNLAYIWSDSYLMIWNLELPEPYLINRISLNGQPYVDVENSRLYQVSLSFSENTFQIGTVDITDLLSPQALGVANINWEGTYIIPEIRITQNHLFMSDASSIKIFDISNPNVPNLIADVSTTPHPLSPFEVVGNILYVITSSEMLIFDWEDSESLNPIGQYEIIPIEQIHVNKDTAYLFWQICGASTDEDGEIVGSCGYGINFINISDPTNPQFAGFFRLNVDNSQRWFDTTMQYDHLFYFESGKHSETAYAIYLLDLSSIED